MNRVCMTGRITKDPDIKYTQSGIAYMGFVLAVNRNQKDANGQTIADFISCKCFAASAEFISKFVKKGFLLSIEGSIQTGKYTNSNGQEVYTTDVMVERVENLTPRESVQQQAPVKQNNQQQTNNNYQQRPNNNTGYNQTYQNPADTNPQLNPSEDDLPF